MFVIIFGKSGNKNNTILLNNLIAVIFYLSCFTVKTKYIDLVNLSDLVSLWHLSYATKAQSH